MTTLEELRSIIYTYDNFCDCWISGMDADDYLTEMDELRNQALKIIKKLEERG